MGSAHCSCSLFTQINHDTIRMQLPQKDTFHILATIGIRNESCVPGSYESFWVKTWTGLPFSTAAGKHSGVCWFDEPPMTGRILIVVTVSHIYAKRGVGIPISHILKQTHRHRQSPLKTGDKVQFCLDIGEQKSQEESTETHVDLNVVRLCVE